MKKDIIKFIKKRNQPRLQLNGGTHMIDCVCDNMISIWSKQKEEEQIAGMGPWDHIQDYVLKGDKSPVQDEDTIFCKSVEDMANKILKHIK